MWCNSHENEFTFLIFAVEKAGVNALRKDFHSWSVIKKTIFLKIGGNAPKLWFAIETTIRWFKSSLMKMNILPPYRMIYKMIEIFNKNSFNDFWIGDVKGRLKAFKRTEDFAVLCHSFGVYVHHVLCGWHEQNKNSWLKHKIHYLENLQIRSMNWIVEMKLCATNHLNMEFVEQIYLFPNAPHISDEGQWFWTRNSLLRKHVESWSTIPLHAGNFSPENYIERAALKRKRESKK